MNISVIDLSIVIGYFIVILWITVRLSGGFQDTDDYFLAGRKMRWPMNDSWSLNAVPDTGSTAALLGVGVVALAFARRRLR